MASVKGQAVPGTRGKHHDVQPAAPVAVLPPHVFPNMSVDESQTKTAWRMRGRRTEDTGVMAMTDTTGAIAPVVVAYSVSKPVDFETSRLLQYSVSAEVILRLLHDSATGLPNHTIAPVGPFDPAEHNWTSFALPAAFARLDFNVTDSPVSARGSQARAANALQACRKRSSRAPVSIPHSPQPPPRPDAARRTSPSSGWPRTRGPSSPSSPPSPLARSTPGPGSSSSMP